MVTPYPHLSLRETITSSAPRHETGYGIGARVRVWIRQMYCGLHGHDNLLHFEKHRLSLQCSTCGRHSPGWELAKTDRPVIQSNGERRRQTMRVGLFSDRRVA